MKLLTVIAAHDRMSEPRKRGQGCWAGNKRLAELIGCNYTNLSTALTDLARWGYIDSRVNPLNKRRRILFVIYDERDAAFVGARHGVNSLPTDKPTDGEPEDNSLPGGEDSAETVCPDFQKPARNQSLGGGEYIPQKRGIDSAEAGKENSVETAHTDGGAEILLRDCDLPQDQRATARRLREIGERLNAVNGFDPTSAQFDDLLRAQHECWDIADQHMGDKIGYWADRLANEIEALVE